MIRNMVPIPKPDPSRRNLWDIPDGLTGMVIHGIVWYCMVLVYMTVCGNLITYEHA